MTSPPFTRSKLVTLPNELFLVDELVQLEKQTLPLSLFRQSTSIPNSILEETELQFSTLFALNILSMLLQCNWESMQ